MFAHRRYIWLYSKQVICSIRDEVWNEKLEWVYLLSERSFEMDTATNQESVRDRCVQFILLAIRHISIVLRYHEVADTMRDECDDRGWI